MSGPGPPSQTSPVKLVSSENSKGYNESRKEKKIGHRRVNEEGTVTYKKARIIIFF